MRMFNMLRAMNAFTAHDSGGVEELAMDVEGSELVDHLIDGGDIPEPDEYGYWTRGAYGGLHYHAYDPATEDDDDDDDDDDAPITCPTCGAPVELDALARQTMADGELMWPRPFCRACLLAGRRRLDAELRQPGKDGE